MHDKAPPPRTLVTQKKLAYLDFQCLDHPPYSTELALLFYQLFQGLRKQLKARHTSSDVEIIAVVDTWLGGQSSDFVLLPNVRATG